jgi:hypothetical protein
MLRSLEPRERGDEEYYYQATDMSTEQVGGGGGRGMGGGGWALRGTHCAGRGGGVVEAAAATPHTSWPPPTRPPTLLPQKARIALAEVVELLEAAEAKAYYGLAINWQPLQALTEALLERSVLTVGPAGRSGRSPGAVRGSPPNRSLGYGRQPQGAPCLALLGAV